MTVLQLILAGTHLLIGIIFYKEGKRAGYVEGRIAVRRHYEQLTQSQQVGR
jgi:hypothetical protein